MSPETYLEVLEGPLGRWGLAVVHNREKDTDRGGTREYFIFLLFLSLIFFLYFLFSFFFLLLLLWFCFVVSFLLFFPIYF